MSLMLLLSLLLTTQSLNKRIKKNIIFTFDDGPSVKHTPVILDTLKKYNVKATFFIMGVMIRWDKKRQAILKRTYQDGHIIGNHTYSHRDIRKLSRARFKWELQYTDFLIKKQIGSKTRFFRPPSGFMPKRAYGTLKKNGGHRVVFWDVLGDLKRGSAAQISKSILDQIYKSKKKKVIVLLHDIYLRTTKILPIILKKLKKDKNIKISNL